MKEIRKLRKQRGKQGREGGGGKEEVGKGNKKKERPAWPDTIVVKVLA